MIVKNFNECDNICLLSTFDYPLIQARTQTLKKRFGAIFGILQTKRGCESEENIDLGQMVME